MKRLIAVAFVWIGCAIAWVILGSTIVMRSGESSWALTSEVHALWGPPMRQQPPSAVHNFKKSKTEWVTMHDKAGNAIQKQVVKEYDAFEPASLESTAITTKVALQHRRKGLLWFPTYAVSFEGRYAFRNPTDTAGHMVMTFPLVPQNAGYDGFEVTDAGGAPVETSVANGAATWRAAVAPKEKKEWVVRWRSRGSSTFTYDAAATGQVKDFVMAMETDFGNVDFPPGSVSPSSHGKTATGWSGRWAFTNLISSAPISIELPQRLNPGPVASRITFFAPVGLLFFFFVVAVFGAAQKRALHPLHYFFLGCAFFAFHLLFAYLVDHVEVMPAFATASAVSLFLVVSYARLFVGWRFALREMAVSQVLYLVLFSATFFWKGYTGLAITVGAILTLFVMMQFTGRVQWDAPPATPKPEPEPAKT